MPETDLPSLLSAIFSAICENQNARRCLTSLQPAGRRTYSPPLQCFSAPCSFDVATCPAIRRAGGPCTSSAVVITTSATPTRRTRLAVLLSRQLIKLPRTEGRSVAPQSEGPRRLLGPLDALLNHGAAAIPGRKKIFPRSLEEPAIPPPPYHGGCGSCPLQLRFLRR